ncbi:LysR substrate-binding domain-containing protein [Chromobacterium sp. S0633]|uniref:LysR substrate-binding domain-containing protein n=1 Tax=Chromobacterium sp. S0633 TaxID=2957805 RepID=UPI0020A0F058|nr:LysR substrate-binding domain-containing protein [Chromobacterium sp. S0633]MCP1290832.1 LysR substrate-binding domain-containing protein [Chromobacterium sp. S0633]
MKPLPPLYTLIAFEAVARLSSFTQAAGELNLSQGAVSRQLQLLEDYLGCKLLQRGTRKVELTPAGEQYLSEVRSALEQLAGATASLMHWQQDKQVTVACSTALASLWLMPNLSAFRQAQPDLSIRILANDNIQELQAFEFDLGVYYFRQPPKDADAVALFDEHMYAVCSPGYLPAGPAQPAALLDETLITMDGGQRDWFNWPQWFAAQSIAWRPAARQLSVTNHHLAVQAALAGQGVALAWGHLIDSYLASGALVMASDAKVTMSGAFYLLLPERRRPKPATRLFADWLASLAVMRR